jgi:hypothetical protein
VSNEREAEALKLATSHQMLGDPVGPRLVDARENPDGTVSIYLNDAELPRHKIKLDRGADGRLIPSVVDPEIKPAERDKT